MILLLFASLLCYTFHQIGEESFKIMTFNNSGNIEDKPDNKYVQCVDNYFPGTFISAQILLNEDDLENNNK